MSSGYKIRIIKWICQLRRDNIIYSEAGGTRFKDGRRVAVEIETGKSYAAYNLKKYMEAAFDEVRGIRV
jgi:hypothetical protein